MCKFQMWKYALIFWRYGTYVALIFLLLLILQWQNKAFYIISLYTESSFLWLVDPHKQKVSTAGGWDYNYIYNYINDISELIAIQSS